SKRRATWSHIRSLHDALPIYVERPAGERREVDDDVGALGHAEGDGGHLNRGGQQVSVVGDLPEHVGDGQVVQIGQVHLHEARGPGVEPAEAVAARADVQHGLDHAVDEELVAQNAVQVEQIEGE